jgi:hypothetical protein
MDEYGAAVANPGEHAYNALPGFAAHGGGTMMLDESGAVGLGRATGTQQQIKGPLTGVGTRPTTLSGAASEVGDVPAGKSKAPIFVALAAVVVVAAGGGFFLLRGNNKPNVVDKPAIAAVPQPVTPPPVEKKDENVTITISSTPTGAKVFRPDKGGVVGTTPYDIVTKKGEPSFDVQVRAEGYTPETRTITTDKTREISLSLVKEVVQPVAANTPPPETTKDKHHHGDKKVVGDKAKGKDDKKGGKEEGDDMKLLQPKF